MGIGGGAGAGRVVCVAEVSVSCKFRTPPVMESWLPGTESPASLTRLWRAMRSSAARSLSCVAGPGFHASPRRTPAYPLSQRRTDSDHERPLSRKLRDQPAWFTVGFTTSPCLEHSEFFGSIEDAQGLSDALPAVNCEAIAMLH